MRHIKPVFPLAAAIALTLALVSGILFISDGRVYAADPEFPGGTTVARSVDENTPPGVNIGAPVSATDGDETGTDAIEFGNTLTYKLGGDDAASFDIDSSTGQLITKAPLDTETTASYEVTVTVDDGETRTTACGTCTATVTITVNDVNELPGTPPPPTVVSGEDDTNTSPADESTTTLKVVWHPLVNTGRPPITGYDVEWKTSTGTTFFTGDNPGTTETEVVNHTGTETTATITGLTAGTTYQVRIRANNADLESNNGPWSLVATGSTNKAGNTSPSFSQATPFPLTIPENSEPGQTVGVRVTANDADSRTLSYEFGGRDADSFDFNTSTGQIRTKRGVTYNHEDPGCGYTGDGANTACTYYVTVVASDGAGGSDALRVAISVTDRAELPSVPSSPTVRPTANSRTSLDIEWSEPANTGPAITGYTVQYRPKGSSDDFVPNTTVTDAGVAVSGVTATISGTDSGGDTFLTPGMAYEVRVRATSEEGTGGWSPLGTGSTNAGNREPVFRDRNIDTTPVGNDATTTRELNENNRVGSSVGRPVAADDGDGDARTYKLVAVSGSEAALTKFEINDSTGQILTKESLNHEDQGCGYIPNNDIPNPTIDTVCTYPVVVEVRDGLDANRDEEANETAADDSITVTITVNDVVEIPTVPTVILTSPQDVTMLGAKWFTENTGPTIINYDLRYRQQGSSAWSDDDCSNDSITADDNTCSSLAQSQGSSAQIENLTVNTSYSVQMRARNAEGVSAWSSAVSQRTNRNKAGTTPNSAPSFVTTTPILDVDESHERRPQDVGSASASDDDGGTLSYSIEGPAKSLFTINSSGLIKTRSGLDFEDPSCIPVTGNEATRCMYSVVVKVSDGQGASIYDTFSIDILDQDEPPSAPSAPRVTATTGTGKKLDVTWSEPGNTGPAIIDYDIRYREVGGSSQDWIDWKHGAAAADATAETGNTATKAEITGLDLRTTYEVEVKAANAEGTGVWSTAGRGTTNASNLRPSFDDMTSLVTLSVNENTRSGQPVGSPVSATDNDGDRLTYTLEGPGKDSFTIVSSSGQIRTKDALDHEERDSYSVTVKVNDGKRRDNSIATKSVTIEIADVTEIPSIPGAPTVVGIPGSTSSVRVTWDEPANTGPDITDYDVHYGEAGTGGFTNWEHLGVDRSTIITGLTAGTRYDVQVRARNADGTSDYSRSGTGSPNPDVANRNPVFSGGARTFSVDENTGPGDPIGDAVGATDPDDDPLRYELEGTDSAAFDIDSGSGQIRTSAALNHEEKPRYSVTVRARDARGGTSTVSVTINIGDVDEPPSTPLSPTVTAVSSTSIQASWDAPDNTGPPITDYDYQYMAPSDLTWTEVTGTTISTTTVTIPGLTPSTYYDVQVRANNAEGSSAWSSAGIGPTNAPGANNPPVFDEGVSTTRSVSADAPAGTNIGAPVTATDADASAGDVVSYRLEGAHQSLFEIVAATGQLQTKARVTLTAGEDYTVIVVANDGTDTARITVTITATAAPPNNPPVFTDGASTTRSVSESASAGTNIGAPVAANDPGDTLTYSLGGADAASFAIVQTTGQLQTAVALDADTKDTYTVTVTATDTANGTATITVTITVTAASSLGELGDQYDANNDGEIDLEEVKEAIRDYFLREISLDDVIEIIRLYFAS